MRRTCRYLPWRWILTLPIARTSSAFSPTPLLPSPEASGPGRTFTLAPTPEPPRDRPDGLSAGPLSCAAKQLISGLLADERAVDRGLLSAQRGQKLSTEKLLDLQVKVIRYSQALEVSSRLVEKGTGAVKEVMRTQV